MSEVLDHVAIRVSDLEASRAFYASALAPLGFSVLHAAGGEAATGRSVGFGRPGADDFWIHEPIANPLDPDGNNIEAVWHAPRD